MLDGWLGGRSQRLIAVDLFGEERVEDEWCRNGWMRAQVRWRVKIALSLMEGGYRDMVAGA